MKTRFTVALTIAAFLGLAGCTSAPESTPPATEAGPAIMAAAPATAFEDYGANHKLVYVPTYSHIYTRDHSRDIDLAATLSVRNSDPDRPITVSTVTYFDSDGSLLRSYLEAPETLAPLASRSFIVEETDRAGGAGANFMVEWSSSELVSEPVIEAVLISTRSSQGISFVTRGIVVRPIGPTD